MVRNRTYPVVCYEPILQCLCCHYISYFPENRNEQNLMESLFVWGVDCEFCWRAKRKDIPVLCFKNILLTHDLGYQKKKRRLLGKEVFPNEYGPARSYYNVRNGILLHRLYPEALNLKSHLRYHFYKRVVFIILYERQKFSKLWALLCGYRDGLRGKSGKWK